MNFKTTSIAELVREYEQAGIAYERALESADHRSANRAHDIMAGSYRELRSRAATSHLLPLLRSENENVRLSVAAHALEFAPEVGEPILQEAASRAGRHQFRAKYALKTWREGTLEFP